MMSSVRTNDVRCGNCLNVNEGWLPQCCIKLMRWSEADSRKLTQNEQGCLPSPPVTLFFFRFSIKNSFLFMKKIICPRSLLQSETSSWSHWVLRVYGNLLCSVPNVEVETLKLVFLFCFWNKYIFHALSTFILSPFCMKIISAVFFFAIAHVCHFGWFFFTRSYYLKFMKNANLLTVFPKH